MAASGLSLALKPRTAIRRNGPQQNPANRRIHSLSQISGNIPTGPQAYPIIGTTVNSSGGLKRSHSVKTNPLRKGSWGARPSAAVANKENDILSEEDEEIAEQFARPEDRSIAETDHDEMQSQTGTERRHSLDTGSYAESYAEDETPGFDGRSSFGGTGSEYTYASGSYVSGSDVDRRTSYGSAAHSNLQHETGSIDGRSEEGSNYEHSDPEDDEATATIAAVNVATPSQISRSEISTTSSGDDGEPMPTESEIDRAVEAVKEEMTKEGIYAPPSDSGVGTDLPTAAFGNESEADADYFRRAVEEESVVG